MKKFLPLAALLIGFCGCLAPDYQQTGELPGKVLATHDTVARYEGVILKPCRFMTADCPDRCDHTGQYAVFTMVDYEDYQKLDAYGDDKQLEFFLRIANREGVPHPDVDPQLLAEINTLEKGDIVEFDWSHVYITTDSAAYPERIVTRLDK